MPEPKFRHPDKVQVLPWREWMRINCPTPQEGLVAEDLDWVILRYGPLEGRPKQADGRFMLIEVKQKGAHIGYAQKRVFGLIDRLLRLGDPSGHFYIGYFVVNWNDDHVVINDTRLTLPEFRNWLLTVRRQHGE